MISTDQIHQISQQVAAEAMLSEDTVSRLRQSFEGIHFTFCMDDDVAETAKPVHADPRFNLYLVDGRNHCLCLTNDAEIASGVVVAEVEE